MKFAYLIMGNFDDKSDKAEIHNGMAQIIGVASIEDAMKVARRLQSEGVGCIELCGAFGEDGARKIVEATENKLPIGYVTHLKEQNDVYNAAFSN
ncbi:MAG: hypothetical protein K2O32_16230 [Acetatifactor sp.]|nr:hypothetical protein [Acetatifactor sp.]